MLQKFVRPQRDKKANVKRVPLCLAAALCLVSTPAVAQSFFSSIAVDPSVGVDRGSAAQVQKVEDTTRFLTFDTYGSKDIGRSIASFGVALPDLAFTGDQFDIVGVIAGPSANDDAELLAGGVGYRIALNNPSTFLFLRGDYADAKLGTSESLAVDAVGRRATMDFGIKTTRALEDRAKLTFAGELGARRSNGSVFGTSVLDEDLRYVRVSALYEQGIPLLFQRRFAAAVAKGFDGFGASPEGNLRASLPGATTNFFRASASVEFSVPLTTKVVTNVGAVGQWSDDSLPLSQRCGFGTNAYMRGFDQGYVNGDKCLGGRLEVAYNIEVPNPGHERRLFTQAYAGLDTGWVGTNSSAFLAGTNDKWASGSLGIRTLRGSFIGEVSATRIFDQPTGSTPQSRNRLWVRAAILF